MVSTAGTTSTPHASAERTAHPEKVFSQLGSLMSTLQDFWNEDLAAGTDGMIKLQAAERRRGRHRSEVQPGQDVAEGKADLGVRTVW